MVGIDLVEPPEVPAGCKFVQADILSISMVDGWMKDWDFNFICASSPCEQFSVHGMKCFHPNPPYPELGIKLFNHTRAICEASGVPYVMENVRAAQQFVGNAVNHCGPFYLWGTGVPPLLPQGIKKGMGLAGAMTAKLKQLLSEDERRAFRMKHNKFYMTSAGSLERASLTAGVATIPPELANAVADYAERICGVPA